MVSEIRKEWIRKHKQRGDIALTVKRLNERNIQVTYPEANSIVSGELVGEFGMVVLKEMERIIRKRQKQLLKETQLYADRAA